MKRLHSVADWYVERGPAFRSIARSAQAFVLLYGGAILENQVQVLSDGRMLPKEWWHAGVLFVAVVTFGIVSYNVRLLLQQRERIEADRKDVLAYASSLADQYTSAAAEAVSGVLKHQAPQRSDVLGSLVTSSTHLKRIVSGAYQLFEAKYGQSGRIDQRIDFEATFMTKSYVDSCITIAAFANRAGLAPTSLKERATNQKLYEGTETARLYDAVFPTLRIISDTADNASAYKELYPGQKSRIKSSIICPVLSPDNVLLGTLVVHCNRSGFFAESDRRYWEELALVFTRRLALEKLKLDALMNSRLCAALGITGSAPF